MTPEQLLQQEIERFSYLYWVLAPWVFLMFQYGLDLVLEDVVPMSRRTIERLALKPWED